MMRAHAALPLLASAVLAALGLAAPSAWAQDSAPADAGLQATGAGAGDSSASLAAPAPTETSKDLLIGFRGVVEAWQDPSVIAHYRSSRFAGAVFVDVPVLSWLAIETEIGYSRTPADPTRAGVAAGSLELFPMSVSAVASKQTRLAELFAGAGYGMAVFTESTDVGTVSGAKPGLDLRAGTRIHTRLLRQQLRPEGVVGPQGLDFELLFGRRQHHAFGIGQGFDFSAWRLGAGMVVRL